MPLFSTFSDNFNDNSRDGSKWYEFGNVAETNQGLKITSSTTTNEYGGYESVNTYDLTNSYVLVQLKDAGVRTVTSHEIQLLAFKPWQSIFWLLTGTTLAAYQQISGVNTQLWSTTYNSATHQWLRLRESVGRTYWDYSADGLTWTNAYNQVDTISVTNLQVNLAAGTWQTESTQVVVVFDNFNYYDTTVHFDSIASTATVYQPALAPGSVTIQPNVVASTAAVYLPLITMYVLGFAFSTDTSEVFEPALTQLPPPPPPPTDWSAIGKEDEKVYIYKVFTASGTYIGVWNDVKDDPQFTQQINTPGTTMTVFLARSPNTTKEVRAHLLTQDDDPLTTEDGARLTAVYDTPNSVGEGTDVDLNYRVDVYVHYGEFGRLLNQLGEPITTEDGNYLLVTQGAPLGVRIFSGFIIDYESEYGDQAGVSVTVASHGWELSHEVVRSGETTTVTYSTTAIETIVKSVLDTNPGVMTYDTASIGTTGVSPTLKFQLNTKLEAIQAAYDQTPDGWYWYGNVAENLVYMKPTASTKQHTFVLGKHIKSLKVKRSIENLVNKVYFVGGEVTPGTPSTTLYKKYQDTTSQANWRVGLARITDRRFTIEANAARKASKQISRYKDPIFTSPLVISSARYDIESIKLGETVGFANFGNFVDSLPPLQIVALSYTPRAVTLQLGEVQKSQLDLITDVENDLSNEQYQDLPTAPS